MDLLCAMWVAPERGKVEWTPGEYARFWGITEAEVTGLLAELKVVCDISVTGHGEVTAMSRRMFREDHERKQARIRKRRQRHARSHATEAQKLEAIYKEDEYKEEESGAPAPLPADAGVSETVNVKELVDGWNDWMKEKLPLVVWPLSLSRQKKARQRLQEHRGAEFWETVFKKILDSPFLLGVNNGSWKCTFDFMIANDSNCIKIWEGQYGNKKGGTTGHFT